MKLLTNEDLDDLQKGLLDYHVILAYQEDDEYGHINFKGVFSSYKECIAKFKTILEEQEPNAEINIYLTDEGLCIGYTFPYTEWYTKLQKIGLHHSVDLIIVNINEVYYM